MKITDRFAAVSVGAGIAHDGRAAGSTDDLLDGRLELSNNLVERNTKPFVIGRKNFLSANMPGGARDSAILYSLVETAKAAGLDSYRYLVGVMKQAPLLDLADERLVERLLPGHV